MLRLDFRFRARADRRDALPSSRESASTSFASVATSWLRLPASVRSTTLFSFWQNALQIAHDRDIGVAILADLGGIDVDVNHAGMRRKGGEPAGHAIVEAHAERDEQIGVVHRHVRGVAAVHARHADEVRMRARQSAQTHQRADRGSVGDFDEFAQFLVRLAEQDAATGVDQRTLGFPEHLRGAPDLAAVAFGENLVAGQMDLGHGLIVAARHEDILRDIDQHRAGTAANLPDRTPHG